MSSPCVDPSVLLFSPPPAPTGVLRRPPHKPVHQRSQSTLNLSLEPFSAADFLRWCCFKRGVAADGCRPPIPPTVARSRKLLQDDGGPGLSRREHVAREVQLRNPTEVHAAGQGRPQAWGQVHEVGRARLSLVGETVPQDLDLAAVLGESNLFARMESWRMIM